MSSNQNPEQVARDSIDGQLLASGWTVQDKDALNFSIGQGQSVREYVTDTGPADYVLFVDSQPVGVMRQAILKKGFTGQLVSQDPADGPASNLVARPKSA